MRLTRHARAPFGPDGDTLASVLRDTWHRLSRFGLDSVRVERETGLRLADLDDADRAWPSALRFRLWEWALQGGAPDDVGLRAACGVRLEDLGVVGHVARHSPTLGAACAAMGRYGDLISQADRFDGRVEGDCVVFRYEIDASPAVQAQLVDNVFTCYGRMLRQLAGDDVWPVRVCLRRSPPADRQAHEDEFGVAVSFGANENMMAFHRRDFLRPVAGADPYLLAVLVRHADQLLQHSQKQGPRPWSERVRACLPLLLSQQRPSIEHAALHLRVPVRSLQRRLAAEGQSFSAVLRQWRQDEAFECLLNTALSMTDIAWRLGFSEPSAFHRAFRAWTGQPPHQWRSGA